MPFFYFFLHLTMINRLYTIINSLYTLVNKLLQKKDIFINSFKKGYEIK